MRHAVVLWVLVILTCGHAPGWSQTVFDEEQLSPGHLSLLVARTDEDDAQELLRRALQHARPEIRAASARVIHAAGASGLAVDVQQALESEVDPETTAEMVRTVLGLGAELETVRLRAFLDRGGVVAAAVADALGRTRGRRAPLLDAIRASDTLAVFLSASSWDPGVASIVGATVLRDGDVEEWAVLLTRSRDDIDHIVLADGLTHAGVGHVSMAWRVATLWHLVAVTLKGGEVGDLVRQALEVPVERSGPPWNEEALARAVLFRQLGIESSAPDGGWATWLGTEADDDVIDAVSAVSVSGALTEAEREAVGRRIGNDEFGLVMGERQTGSSDPGADDIDYMRTLWGYPPGYVSDVLRVAGCRPEAGEGIIAVVDYSARGRPSRISLSADFDSDRACHVAARTLLMTGISPVGHAARPERSETLVVLFVPPFLDCLAANRSRPLDRSSAMAGSGRLEPPTKTRDVAPFYPQSAQQDRVQGTVVLRSVISPGGCVSRIETVTVPDRRLAVAGMVAVSHWEYTPTLLRGRPVPVIMTVTVNFQLR